MTLIEIVKELQTRGNAVEWRKRSDGGIIITQINGVKYSGASGNVAGRSIVGATLSVARVKQLEFNVNKYIRNMKKPQKSSFDTDIDLLKMLKKAQRLWNKNRVRSMGKITKRKLRYYYKTEGRQKAVAYLESRIRYAHGLAYPENVDWLVERIRRLANEYQSNELMALADKIFANRMNFKEAWIEPCYQSIYKTRSKNEVSVLIATLHSITNL